MSIVNFQNLNLFDRRKLVKAAAGFICASSWIGERLAQSQSSQPQHSAKNDGSLKKRMMDFMLGHEQFSVPDLVELGTAAERAGFDLLATSDHFQPWQDNEGHSGQAWVTMSALGARTNKIWIGPTVTCPTFRYNPAV